MPQQAAGTRIEPAVSVPKAMSAIPLPIATADPDEEPPGISFRPPWGRIYWGSEIFVKPRRSYREFSHVRFADELHFSLTRDGKAGRVSLRGFVCPDQQFGTGRGDYALHVDVVFDCEPWRTAAFGRRPMRDKGAVTWKLGG